MIYKLVSALCCALLFDCCWQQFPCNADECGCNAVLVPSVEHVIQDKATRLAFLRIVDKASFVQIKGTRGGGLKLPIDGVPIGAEMKWEDFEMHRKKEFAMERFILNETESISILKTSLPKVVVDAWTKCKEACGKQGLRCWVVNEDEKTVIVKVTWNPSPPAKDTIITDCQIEGGTGRDTFKGRTFQVNESQTLQFNRKRGEPFFLTVNGGGFTSTAVAPVFRPEPPAPKYEIRDIRFNIYAKHDAEGNRPGLDLHDTKNQSDELGKNVLEAKVLHNPFANLMSNADKVTPNRSKVTFNFVLTDEAHKEYSKGGDPKLQNGPVFFVRILVRFAD